MAFKRRRLIIFVLVLGGLVGGAVAGAPALGRWYIRSRVLPRLARGLSRTITVGGISVGASTVTLTGVRVASTKDLKGAPMASTPEVRIEYKALSLLSGPIEATRVTVQHPTLNLVRHADGSSNFLDLARRRRKGSSGRYRIHELVLREGSVALDDRKERLRVEASRLDGALVPGGASKLRLSPVRVTSPRTSSALAFSAVELRFQRLKRELLGKQLPEVRVEGGRVQLLPRLVLSGIRGTIAPAATEGRIQIDLEGSYGGAEAKLWSAAGWLSHAGKEGKLRIKAARFSLGRIASILKRTPVIMPVRTMIDGRLDLTFKRTLLHFEGKLRVKRLNLFHPALARTPVLDLAGTTKLEGKLDLGREVLELEQLAVESRGVTATLSGKVERLFAKPVIDLRLQVPQVTCQAVLDAFPPSLLPELQGFTLKGKFEADLHTKIDYEALGKLELGGKVGIRRCKVTRAPEQVSGERLAVPFEHEVEPSPQLNLNFMVGPENPDFTPYAEISPYVIKAFLTTEDGAFFRHRGYISSMFRKALSRNLKQGGFRLGASTISMQMVKNVLLSHRKTLSRKLQELFLVWYLEQKLSKQRIMEIYLNAIEFGPSIYGVGAAARHYFGKKPQEITPLEAAFFASILPSPKRRYIQYCRGQLSESWDRYVRRILRRMGSKGHISEGEVTLFSAQQIVFARDLDELSEKDCAKQVKDLLDSWREANINRLKQAIMRSAPHQVEMYIAPLTAKKSKSK